MNHEAFAIWITGLPGAGKSSIAEKLVEVLKAHGIKVAVLESDQLRQVLTPNPTYSEEEREVFYKAMVYIGKLLVENGVGVIFDATANRRKFRDAARQVINKFIEVWVRCPVEVCMERDPKGIYKRALKGESKTVPGVGVEYEEPLNPEVVVDSAMDLPEDCAKKIMQKFEEFSEKWRLAGE